MGTDDDRAACFVADRGDAGRRLDLSVLRRLHGTYGLSRSAVHRLLGRGAITVNGIAAARPAQRLSPGDLVSVGIARRPAVAPVRAEARPLEILFEDADVLVVVKPPGVVVHPTALLRHGTLLNALAGHAARSSGEGEGTWSPHLVQRLDRGTSGVLVVAKSPRVHAVLQDAAAEIVKEYLAVVWGTPHPPRGTLDGALGRDPLDRRRVVVRAGGAAARTEYARLARSGTGSDLSLMTCRLLTGRTHQIRVHLADRGWPIVGDAVYGRPPRRRLDDVSLDRAARGFPRPALHAWRLRLPLPGSGKVMQFVAPLPSDLAGLLALARLREPTS